MPDVKYCFPSGLFDDPVSDSDWSCVVVRPRWEKKFSRWLVVRRMPHFLPLYNRRTVSGRKVRWSEIPLFPSYVFVHGIHHRPQFADTDCVVRVLCPQCDAARLRLSSDIRGIHALLASGADIEPVQEWVPGQRVCVKAGPLAGTVGEFIRRGANGQLIIWVNMLGVGAAVNLPPEVPVEP